MNVKEIKIKADHGTLSWLPYMPKGAGADDPRPVIITTHGYLNTKEMQDAPAIEMSRRGYIVLALDMYDHGDSRWENDIPVKDFQPDRLLGDCIRSYYCIHHICILLLLEKAGRYEIQ